MQKYEFEFQNYGYIFELAKRLMGLPDSGVMNAVTRFHFFNFEYFRNFRSKEITRSN